MGPRSMQATKSTFTDEWPASEDLEAEGLAVDEVLVPAVDAGAVLEAAVEEALFEAADEADEAEEAAELDAEDDSDFAAPPFAFFLPAVLS